MSYIKLGRKFLCCNFGKDEDNDPLPSRPVELDNKAEENQPAPASPHGPSESQSSGSQYDGNKAIHATPTPEGPEKQSIFGPRDEQPRTSDEPGSGLHIPAKDIHDCPAGPSVGGSDDNSKGKGKCSVPVESPPPYHNWQDAVPDTSAFPPPPVNAFLYSNTGNASQDDAMRAHDFCDNAPLWKPKKPSAEEYSRVQRNRLSPVKPREYQGDLNVVGDGRWKGKTPDHNKDCILLTVLPMYFAVDDSPLNTEAPKTIYFEVTLRGLHGSIGESEPTLSIGYAARPYPSWRFPGWERGSLGVCADDGSRFVNDSFGGKGFTTRFNIGEAIGLGMTFSVPNEGAASKQHEGKAIPLAVEIFLTRNGEKAGSWNLHEERDADSGSIEGLEGDYDLYGAVGIFGGVDFEVCFDPSGWKWKPSSDGQTGI